MRWSADSPASSLVPKARRKFVENRLRKRDQLILKVAILAAYPFHAVGILVEPYLVPQVIWQWLFPAHLVIPALVAIIHGAFRAGRSVAFPYLLLQYSVAATYGVAVRLGQEAHPEVVPVAAKALEGLTVFLILLCPFHGIRLIAATAGYAVILAFSYATVDDPVIWSASGAVLILGALVLQSFLIWQARLAARRDFDDQCRSAPAHIVAQAALADRSPGEVFAPEKRFCVCLSSDWRNYQHLSETLAPDELSTAITRYYDHVENTLKDCVPSGTYFTDWIADELFIVLYAKDHKEEKELVNVALKVARRLLLEKQEFYEVYGVPEAIDVGLAAGEAVLGMLGPDRTKKATALGDVPGRARRNETAGKFLRQNLGHTDRVIFGRDCLFMISQPYEIHEFSLNEGTKLRGIHEDCLFYMEAPVRDETTRLRRPEISQQAPTERAKRIADA